MKQRLMKTRLMPVKCPSEYTDEWTVEDDNDNNRSIQETDEE